MQTKTELAREKQQRAHHLPGVEVNKKGHELARKEASTPPPPQQIFDVSTKFRGLLDAFFNENLEREIAIMRDTLRKD